MKIYILCDMEGASGVITQEMAWVDINRRDLYEEGRRLLTEDVNSAVSALLAAGVDELLVCDTHEGGGNNFLWDRILADPRVVYESPYGSCLMPGLDETFDGLILLGHHAKAGTQGAFLDHTWSSTEWFDFMINSVSVGEIGIEACYAGHWNVPLVMVQGDDFCCLEAQELIPGVVTSAVKQGICRSRARGMAPELARQLTASRIAEAVNKAAQKAIQPYKPALPMQVRFTATTTSVCERSARMPGVTRLDGRTLECRVHQQCDVVRWLIG